VSGGFVHEHPMNESKEWYTPREIFEGLKTDFDLDPCSPGADVVPWIPAKKHFTILENGLGLPWDGFVFLNPPYGYDTPIWMARLNTHHNGIALVFSRCDTKWGQRYLPSASAILFIAGRVNFVPASEAARYAAGGKLTNRGCGAGSMLVGYGDRAREILLRSQLGFIVLPTQRILELNV